MKVSGIYLVGAPVILSQDTKEQKREGGLLYDQQSRPQ